MQTGAMEANAELLERLRAIGSEFPELARAARLFGAILPLVRPDAPCGPLPELTRDAARERLENGHPLLHDMDLEIDVQGFADRMVDLATAAEKAGELVDAAGLRSWFGTDRDAAGATVQGVLSGDEGRLGAFAQQTGTDPALLNVLALTALKPDLQAWGRTLAPRAEGIPWRKAFCFVCGAMPVFAELRGNHQSRHLRCGVCGADWQVPRLLCPQCGNDAHRTLTVLMQEQDPRQARIEACDRCGTYLKAIPSFEPIPVDMLPVEDLATAHLDAVARERGYRRLGC